MKHADLMKRVFVMVGCNKTEPNATAPNSTPIGTEAAGQSPDAQLCPDYATCKSALTCPPGSVLSASMNATNGQVACVANGHYADGPFYTFGGAGAKGLRLVSHARNGVVVDGPTEY